MSGLFGSDSWLYIILIGFFVGLLGRFFMPGNNRMGCLLTIVLGIAGAVFAGWFGREMGWYAAGQPAGFIGAAQLITAIIDLDPGQAPAPALGHGLHRLARLPIGHRHEAVTVSKGRTGRQGRQKSKNCQCLSHGPHSGLRPV